MSKQQTGLAQLRQALEIINAELPRQGYAREAQVLRVIPWGRSTLWAKAKSGQFPKPIKLSPNVTAWSCAQIWQWLESREQQAAAEEIRT